MRHSLITRVLHVAVAAAILVQLSTSWVMRMPRPAGTRSTTEILAFSAHQYLGLGSLAILLAFWLWALMRRGETRIGALVPWFSPGRRAALMADAAAELRALTSFAAAAPAGGGTGAFASAVHGLGLLTAMTMAVTGAVVYAVMASDGSLAAPWRSALTLHRLVANLMWAYLIGHAAMALLHEMMGRRILTRMFAFGRASQTG